MADGGDGGLIQADANFAASATDVPLTGMLTAVVIERGQAHQSGNGLPVAAPQLGQMGDECSRHLRADAGDGLQDLVAGLEGRGAAMSRSMRCSRSLIWLSR